jgi:hypothetical protein
MLPVAAFVPVHPSDATHDVALAAAQVSVDVAS